MKGGGIRREEAKEKETFMEIAEILQRCEGEVEEEVSEKFFTETFSIYFLIFKRPRSKQTQQHTKTELFVFACNLKGPRIHGSTGSNIIFTAGKRKIDKIKSVSKPEEQKKTCQKSGGVWLNLLEAL